MTRIIGGVAGSRKLASPAKSTRPTSDRIRESIFNRLEANDLLEGIAVLDLYAGTGALGLEAASRGAAAAVLVEQNRQAVEVCQKNAESVLQAYTSQRIDNPPKLKIQSQAVQAALGAGASLVSYAGSKFDLVFIDPPYEVSGAEVSQNLGSLKSILNEDATVIVERSSRGGEFDVPIGYELELTKDYGDTSAYWLIFVGSKPAG